MSQDYLNFRKCHYLLHHIPTHYAFVSIDDMSIKLMVKSTRTPHKGIIQYLEPFYIDYDVVSLRATYRNTDGTCFWGIEFHNFTQLIGDLNKDRTLR